MNRNYTSRIAMILFLGALLLCSSSLNVRANGDDPPTPGELFNGRDFTKDHWDINVFNNSKWAHPDVNNATSWENNTWNIKWIKEGNFEMGMLAFVEKVAWEDGRNVTYTSPAQMWWQHAYKDGSEIMIGSMHAAWFGYDDNNQNGMYDDTLNETINPFFYMG